MRTENLRTKLWIKIMQEYGSVQNFAEAAGLTRQTISNILHGSNMNQRRILSLCELLRIDRSEIVDYFFPDDVEIMEKW